MPRVIVTLLFTSIFIITVHSDMLKCYMCTSLSNEDCGSDMSMNLIQPLECTNTNIVEWQRSLQQHNVLNPLVRLFEVDDMSQHYQGLIPNKDTACAKMVIKIAKQDVIVRMCQTAKTEVIDPCKTTEEKLKISSIGKMEQCALCYKDACNGTMSLSSKILYTFLSFFSTLIAFYH